MNTDITIYSIFSLVILLLLFLIVYPLIKSPKLYYDENYKKNESITYIDPNIVNTTYYYIVLI